MSFFFFFDSVILFLGQAIFFYFEFKKSNFNIIYIIILKLQINERKIIIN